MMNQEKDHGKMENVQCLGVPWTYENLATATAEDHQQTTEIQM